MNHSCEKWDRLMQLQPVEILKDGTLHLAMEEHINDQEQINYDQIPFEFCPYCKEKLKL